MPIPALIRSLKLRPRDAAIALVVAWVQTGGTNFAGENQDHQLSVFGGVLLALGGVALLGRRAAPRAVLGIELALTVTFMLLSEPDGPVFFGLIVALFTAVMAGHRTFAWSILVVGYGLVTWLPALVTSDDPPGAPGAMAVIAWLLVLGAAAELARARRERTIERERAAEQEARQRAGEERMRIARELHDVLAHNISLINVQAGVALHLLDEKPEQARPALTAIKQASKETLAELRSVLDILRQADDDTAPRSPTSGLERLDELLAGVRAGGLTVDCSISGERRPLPAGVDLAAFRIVQEALTNVRRHAGPASATVRLGYLADELRVEIEDDGPGMRNGNGRPTEDVGEGSGNGIPGMRERAAALGGTLDAGPRADGGGFRVAARLPLGDGA